MLDLGNLPKRLRRAAASDYLRQVHNIERTVGTLAKLASIGGGPEYELINRTPFYTPLALDEWVERLRSAAAPSSSAHAANRLKRCRRTAAGREEAA